MSVLFRIVLIATLLLASCGPRFISRIDLTREQNWRPEQVTVHPELDTFIAEGELSLLAGEKRYKVDYQIHCAEPALWRIDVFGFFHVHGATIIMRGLASHVFHDGIWEEPKPWPAISASVFGIVLPYKVLSLMVGGRFDLSGECAETVEGKVCREYDLHYLFRQGEIVEIKSEAIEIIKVGDTWRGVSAGSPEPFYLWPERIEKKTDFDPAMFQPTQEKDIFDEI